MPLGKEPGADSPSWSLNCPASLCSSLCQPLTTFRIPAFVTSLYLPLQPSPFLFQVAGKLQGLQGPSETNLFSLNPAHTLISK